MPELFTAPALERLQDNRRRDELAAVPYFYGLMTGETDSSDRQGFAQLVAALFELVAECLVEVHVDQACVVRAPGRHHHVVDRSRR